MVPADSRYDEKVGQPIGINQYNNTPVYQYTGIPVHYIMHLKPYSRPWQKSSLRSTRTVYFLGSYTD